MCVFGGGGGLLCVELKVGREGLIVHCKETIPKIRNKCSQKRNRSASVTISSFICL